MCRYFQYVCSTNSSHKTQIILEECGHYKNEIAVRPDVDIYVYPYFDLDHAQADIIQPGQCQICIKEEQDERKRE
jgi:hypothetical protein